MKIVYYTDASYTETKIEETYADIVLGTGEPEELTEEDRKMIRSGKMIPMCNFPTMDGHWKAIPWQRVIEIRMDYIEGVKA